MSRSLDRDPATGDLWIRFGFDAQLLAVVRGLPGRRWQPSTRRWVVPARYLPEAAARLVPLGFQLTPAVSECLAELSVGGSDSGESTRSAVPAPAVPAPAVPAPREGEMAASAGPSLASRSTDLRRSEPQAPSGLTVSELNQRVRSILLRSFSSAVWLVGEVVGFDRNVHKRHVYFQIVEKTAGDDRPAAVVNAVLFDGKRQEVLALLAKSDPPLAIQDGIRIRVRVKLDLYVPRGSYQVIVEELDPEFTQGEIARRRERILAELGRLGLVDRNRAVPLPVPALRVGLITSRESDAYNDFIHELSRSGYPFQVVVHDAHVQGDRLEGDLLAALRWFEQKSSDFDVIAIVRGGGARTELMAFDSLAIGKAVAEHPLKVLIGIGHQRDSGVLDAIAHAEKTPTAVAQYLVLAVEHEERRVVDAGSILGPAANARLVHAWQRFDQASRRLARGLEIHLERAQRRVDRLAERLSRAARARLQVHQSRLDRADAILPRVGVTALAQRRVRLETAAARIVPVARGRLERLHERLELLSSRVAAADPRRRLALGYVWLRDSEGRLVRSVDQAPEGSQLTVELADGRLDLEVRTRRRRE